MLQWLLCVGHSHMLPQGSTQLFLPLTSLFWGEHFSLCLVSIYFHQMFEARRFNKRPPF